MDTNKKCIACLLPILCVIFAFPFVVGAILKNQKILADNEG